MITHGKVNANTAPVQASTGRCVVHAGDAASQTPEATPTPLALTEARLQKYLGYRKEMIVFITAERKKMNAALKKESVAQLKSLAEITAETDKGTADLRAKHGITEAEDKDLGDAITDVLGAAMTRGEMLAPTIQEFDLLLAHFDEIQKLQMDSMKAAVGGE